MIDQFGHNVQHQVYSSSDTGARVALTIDDIQAILEDLCLRSQRSQFHAALVMSGAGIAIQQTSAPGEQRPGADGDQTMSGTDRSPQPVDNCCLIGIVIIDIALCS